MRTGAVLLALSLASCTSIHRPQIEIAEDRCEALQNWALEGLENERVANWTWVYPEDVIPLRAAMSVCPDDSCVHDMYDDNLYSALSPYTHSLRLGEFVWLLAEDCFGASVELRPDEFGGVASADVQVRLEAVSLQMRFEQDECVFLPSTEELGSQGCASFRTSPNR